MVLKDIQENQNWLRMKWQCSFPMPWSNILFATRAMLPLFQNAEVLIGSNGAGSEKVNPSDNPPEKEILALQGNCTHFGGKVAIHFYTNTNNVVITISKAIGFRNEYQYLSEAVGPFMDNIELRMYAKR